MTIHVLRRAAQSSYIALAVWVMLWEVWLAPSHSARAFWLAVRVLPLLVPLAGILRDRPRSYIFACLIALLYFIEAVVLTYTRTDQMLVLSEPRLLAWVELLLVLLYFFCAAFYVRARRRRALIAIPDRAETES